jgi:hypothetical protein
MMRASERSAFHGGQDLRAGNEKAADVVSAQANLEEQERLHLQRVGDKGVIHARIMELRSELRVLLNKGAEPHWASCPNASSYYAPEIDERRA